MTKARVGKSQKSKNISLAEFVCRRLNQCKCQVLVGMSLGMSDFFLLYNLISPDI